MHCFDKSTVYKNITAYITKMLAMDDALAMRNLRRGTGVTLSCADSYKINDKSTFNSKYNILINEAMQDALYIWANHQYAKPTGLAHAYCDLDANGTKIYSSTYKYNFGNVLFTIYKGQKSSWDNFIARYEKMDGRDISRLRDFIKMSIDKALSINPNIQLDYGNLAYYFQRIRQNPENIKEFVRDNFLAFSRAVSDSLDTPQNS